MKKNLGILFWITGLPGSGKTTIGNILLKNISKKYGPTIVLSGDDLRKDFSLVGYKKKERQKIGLMYSNFFLRLIKQNINIIFSGVVLSHKIQMYNRKKINNYLEIFIDSDILKNKKINNISRFNKNVVGIDIKPEYPMKPDIKIFNNFKTPLKSLANEIAVLINKKLIK
jgi:adenylylsulfate kinase-like enzyme|tara:strand:- start:2071 stop:2580 length:510 start_codon:yes stop_codon:yes gene_type:complete